MSPTTRTVDAPGATISYDVHGDPASGVPLLIIGSPMDATGFVTLAGHFPDRPVVTYDPRGTARSPRTDGADETTPAEHAADLHAVIEALGAPAGGVDVFASSGGAVNALALVQEHPQDVRTLVAHEPPLAAFLPDREQQLATGEAIRRLYHEQGFGPAMAKFIEYVGLQGPVPDGYADRPAPDPAMFGLPTQDDGNRDDALLGQNMRTCGGMTPELDKLRAAPTRIVLGVGEDSGQTLAARGALSVAEALGVPAVVFPGDHAGFLGGEYGMSGKPDEFGAKLREVLG